MTQQDKQQLLLKDLCARLPYGVKINIRSDYTFTMEDIELNPYHIAGASYYIEYGGLRPYLRTISSMTMEEQREYISVGRSMSPDNPSVLADWLNEHHFDFRNLIDKGLALEAKEGMYKTE